MELILLTFSIDSYSFIGIGFIGNDLLWTEFWVFWFAEILSSIMELSVRLNHSEAEDDPSNVTVCHRRLCFEQVSTTYIHVLCVCVSLGKHRISCLCISRFSMPVSEFRLFSSSDFPFPPSLSSPCGIFQVVTRQKDSLNPICFFRKQKLQLCEPDVAVTLIYVAAVRQTLLGEATWKRQFWAGGCIMYTPGFKEEMKASEGETSQVISSHKDFFLPYFERKSGKTSCKYTYFAFSLKQKSINGKEEALKEEGTRGM